jgi:hypothetical protein
MSEWERFALAHTDNGPDLDEHEDDEDEDDDEERA